MNRGFVGKLLERLDRLGPQELQQQLIRLAGEKGLLETILRSLQEGVLVLTPAGEVAYANPAVGEMLGFEPASASGEPIGRYLKEVDWTTALGQRQTFSRELEISYPRRRLLRFYLVPLDENPGALVGFALIFHDLTVERAQAQLTLQSEKLSVLTLLAAGVAHELGNPLNSLNIHLQLAERDLRDLNEQDPATERLRESLTAARSEIGRLDDILKQFLQAIRPTVPVRQNLALNPLVQAAADALASEAAGRDVLIETNVAPALPLVYADPGQIRQALHNLIKNALQAVESGGLVRLATSASDTHVAISVSDNGPGIAPEHVTRLFEPFFTTKPTGTGLGLLIVQRIAREHGGELMVESSPTRGTTARLLLPLAEKRMRLLPAGDAADATPS